MTSNSNGVVTVTAVSVISSQPSADPNIPTHHSQLGMTVGLAVGVPVGIIALGLIAFCTLRRRKRAQQYNAARQSGVHRAAPPDDQTPELMSAEPKSEKRHSRLSSWRKSELAGSSPTVGQNNSPAISSPPPAYHAEMDAQRPAQELWAGYIPYRQPRAELPSHEQPERM